MMKYYKLFLLITLFVFFVSCNNQDQFKRKMKEVDELYCGYLAEAKGPAEKTLKEVEAIFMKFSPQEQERACIGFILLYARFTSLCYFYGEKDKSEYYFNKYKSWYLKNKKNSKVAKKLLKLLTIQTLSNEKLEWDTKANNYVPPKWFLDIKHKNNPLPLAPNKKRSVNGQ